MKTENKKLKFEDLRELFKDKGNLYLLGEINDEIYPLFIEPFFDGVGFISKTKLIDNNIDYIFQQIQVSYKDRFFFNKIEKVTERKFKNKISILINKLYKSLGPEEKPVQTGAGLTKYYIRAIIIKRSEKLYSVEEILKLNEEFKKHNESYLNIKNLYIFHENLTSRYSINKCISHLCTTYIDGMGLNIKPVKINDLTIPPGKAVILRSDITLKKNKEYIGDLSIYDRKNKYITPRKYSTQSMKLILSENDSKYK